MSSSPLNLRALSEAARVRARYAGKLILRPVLFRHLPIGLEPERLMLWLQTLAGLGDVEGDVVEIGCSGGGTAAFASTMLTRLGQKKSYWAVDTFGGFVEEQFAVDERLGTDRERHRHLFSANSERLVRRVLDQHGAHDVKLVKGDIVTMSEDQLPERIAACLIDVDLSEPVLIALRKVYPRLVPGGAIVVDDCGEGPWRAAKGYSTFMREIGRELEYRFGMGLVAR